MRARASSKSRRVSGSMPASIADVLSHRAEGGIGQKRLVGEALEKGDKMFWLFGGDGKSLESLALHRTLDAAARVVVDCRFEGFDAAVVHVGCGHGNVAERRRAKTAHVAGLVRAIDQPVIALRIGSVPIDVVKAGIVEQRLNRRGPLQIPRPARV